MTPNKLFTAAAFVAIATMGAAPSSADSRDRDRGRHESGRADGRESARNVEQGRYGAARPDVGGRVVGRPVPHTVYAPRIVRPNIIGVVPYRPYVYRPTFGLRFRYRNRYGYSYPYRYNDPYGYGYPAPPGYVTAVPGRPYGGVRIVGAPREAGVFADGYYVGIVDDFDGVFQHMNLEAGPHRIEIRAPGYPPVEFDVNVQPGETITYRADLVQP
jgi:hypothetical protein